MFYNIRHSKLELRTGYASRTGNGQTGSGAHLVARQIDEWWRDSQFRQAAVAAAIVFPLVLFDDVTLVQRYKTFYSVIFEFLTIDLV